MAETTVLGEIVARQKEQNLTHTPEAFAHLKNQVKNTENPPISVLNRIHSQSNLAIAAEFKRASPSKGDINVNVNLLEQVDVYAGAGASVISILTQSNDFKGSLEDLSMARSHLNDHSNRPALLRKDFILDEYQVYESRLAGADTILLIVAILNEPLLQRLVDVSRELGMEPLVEVNNVKELDIALQVGAKFIGVNNRNLWTFELDMNTTSKIAESLKERHVNMGKDGVTLFALSGVSTRRDVENLMVSSERIFHGILVGELLMRSADPASTIMELLERDVADRNNSVSRYVNGLLVKVCGMTDVESALVACRSGANMIGLIFVPNTPRCLSVEKAKDIVAEIRRFGERSQPVKFSLNDSKDEWFVKQAKRLLENSRRTPLAVGVFQNQTSEEINYIVEEVGLDMVQLHGEEDFEMCKEINVPVTKTVHLPDLNSQDSVNIEAISDQIKPGFASAILLDTSVKGQQGGTGLNFDWHIAECLSQNLNLPVLMAGGLTPDNVGRAIQIASPFGVDVSSGVENEDRTKNHEKIRLFCKNALSKSGAETTCKIIKEEDEE